MPGFRFVGPQSAFGRPVKDVAAEQDNAGRAEEDQQDRRQRQGSHTIFTLSSVSPSSCPPSLRLSCLLA